MKRVRISNSSVNTYGTRILTQGVDLTQYERNPVMLYMHQRGTVVGYMKDVRVEGDDITGEPVFDEATPLSQQLKKQMEVGSVRMVSAGLEILELSDAPELMMEGQTNPTVTRCRLGEVSIVDIGSNNDALVLMHDGKRLELSAAGDAFSRILQNKNINHIHNKQQDMDIKKIALALGLDEKADEAAVMGKLGELTLAADRVKTLETEKSQLTLAAITASVETAIKEKRIDASKKEQFINLGKQIGNEQLQQTFEAMHPQVKLSAVLTPGAGHAALQDGAWKTLSDVPSDKLLELRQNNTELYHQLYKAEYGQDF